MFARSCKRGIKHAQSDITELNGHGLFFDELTNKQAEMHYSRHCLTASVAYVTTLTYASTNKKKSSPCLPIAEFVKT